MKLLCFFLLLCPSLVMAQGSLAAGVARELTEALVKRTATAGSRELAEIGGEVAVREILQAAETEGGEVLVKKLSSLATSHGVIALQAAKAVGPKLAAETVEKIPGELAENGLRAFAKDPLILTKLVKETGHEALEAAAKHPGIGVQIASKLGKEGAETAARVSGDAAVGLARHADDLAKLGAPERASFLAMFRTAPEKALKFLGKHPVGTLTAAAVVSFLANPEAYLGSADAPGLIERLMAKPIRWVGIVIASLLALWGLRQIFRSQKAAV